MDWEYKIVNAKALVMWLGMPVEGPDAETQLTEALNRLGSEGWEAFSETNGWFFMKRPRPA